VLLSISSIVYLVGSATDVKIIERTIESGVLRQNPTTPPSA
jgi:hypothetical protein